MKIRINIPFIPKDLFTYPDFHRFDRLIIITIFILASIGLIMVYSSSSMFAYSKFHDTAYYFKRHFVFLLVGFLLFAIGLSRNTYHFVRKHVSIIFIFTLILLLLVLIPGIGKIAGGSRRWIQIAFFTLQPAELAKLSIMIFLSHALSRKQEKLRDFKQGLLPILVMVGLTIILLMLQPDFGTSVVIVVSLTALLFITGFPLGYLLIGILSIAPLIYYLILASPYRLKRLLGFLDPWKYRMNIGYQLSESLMSIGSGGLSGLGLGNGKQKLFFLPAAHTDFIFAVIGEELGLLGVLLVLTLYMIIIFYGFIKAKNASDLFGRFLAFSISFWFGFQALINMAVTLALVPTKGFTLPLISYGGNSLCITLLALGLLISIPASKAEYSHANGTSN